MMIMDDPICPCCGQKRSEINAVQLIYKGQIMNTQISAEEIQLQAREAQIKKAVAILDNIEINLSDPLYMRYDALRRGIGDALAVLRGEGRGQPITTQDTGNPGPISDALRERQELPYDAMVP